MHTITLDEAESRLSEIIERAGAGEEFIIEKGGKPVARLVPPIDESLPPRRVLGLARGRLKTPDDFNSLEAATIQALFEGSDEQ